MISAEMMLLTGVPFVKEQILSAIVDLTQELQEVTLKLEAAVDALYSPLRELAKAHLTQSQPLLRAAWVLTIGADADGLSIFRQQRIYLAAAVEMLRIAISLHKLLLAREISDSDNTPDKPILGSAILTGDYCFGQAAWLAAQTDNTTIVQMFAQALKSISEGQLRHLFQATGRFENGEEEQRVSEDHLLFITGGQAAHLLGSRDSAELVPYLETMSFSHEALLHFARRCLEREQQMLEQPSIWQWFIDFCAAA